MSKKEYGDSDWNAMGFDEFVDPSENEKQEALGEISGKTSFSEQDEALSAAEMRLLRTTLQKSNRERGELPPHDRSDSARLRRWVKKNKLLSVAIVIVLLALLAAIGFGIYALVSHVNSRPNTSAFTVELGQEKPFEVAYDEAVRGGVLYVEMKQIARMTDSMIISGTKQHRKFTADGGTSLRFENGSEIAEINGERVKMRVTPYHGGETVLAKAVVTDTECWVPYEFLASVIGEGLLLRVDSDRNMIVIRHIMYVTDGDRENAEPAEILFALGNHEVLPVLTEPPKYEWIYGIDIEPYLTEITTENLLLANKRHPLGEEYSPDLTELSENLCWSGESHRLERAAAIALGAMMQEMHQAGIEDVYVTSSYRSYAQQRYLFNKYVSDHLAQGMTQEEAEAAATTYSARAGESEHQTGLCVDFTAEAVEGELSNEFAGTEASAWLLQNAYKFGFILRYPEEKVDLTEYSYESWHYRFVGREAATEIFFEEICLEEYLGVAPTNE